MMKRILFILAFLCVLDFAAMAQGAPPLCMSEVDGSPNKCGITRIKVTNGTLSITGSVATITISGGGGGGITIGTTTIASGTTTRVLYDNAGVVGEYSITGTGNVAMSASPTFTGTVAAAAATFSGTIVQTSASATAFESGPNGGTNPVFRLVNSTASAATGLSITGNAAGSGVTLTALSSGTNEHMLWQPKGASVGVLVSRENAFGLSTVLAPVIGTNSTVGSTDLRLASQAGFLFVNGNPISASSYTVSAYIQATASRMSVTSSGTFSFTSSSDASATPDTILRRAAAANLAFGATDAASPVAQTISVQNVVGGTTDTAGAAWTFSGSRGTGTGAGGSLIFQTAPAGSTGSSQNSLVTAFTLSGNTTATFNPLVTTGTGSTAGFVVTANSLTTGNGAELSSSSVSSGNVVSIAATGTAAASNSKHALVVATSGANATSSQTTYGAEITNTSTGTSSTNVALQLTASGGSAVNRALNIVAGDLATEGQIVFNASGAQKGIISSSTGVRFTGNVGGVVIEIANWGGGNLAARFGSAGQLQWDAAGNPGGTGADLIVRRAAAANLALGAADAASPVAQTLSVQNVVAGTSNTAGVTTTLRGSLGTSQGSPGRIHLTGGALIATSGTTQQTAIDRIISGATKVLTNNSAVTIVNVTAATETNAAGVIDYTVEVLDGTDVQYEVGSVAYGVSNKGGVFSGNTATKFGNHQNATSGTLTVTFAISGANPALLSVNANSSLTPSTGYPRITYTLRNLTQQAVAVQ